MQAAGRDHVTRHLRHRTRHVQRQVAGTEGDVVQSGGTDRIADCQVAPRRQLHVVVARDDPAGGGRPPRRVGHGADGQRVQVAVADRAVVVGGQRGHVVVRIVQVDRPRSQQLQSGGRDHVTRQLRHRSRHVQRQIPTDEGDVVVDREVAPRGQPHVVVGGCDPGRSEDGLDSQAVGIVVRQRAVDVGGQCPDRIGLGECEGACSQEPQVGGIDDRSHRLGDSSGVEIDRVTDRRDVLPRAAADCDSAGAGQCHVAANRRDAVHCRRETPNCCDRADGEAADIGELDVAQRRRDRCECPRDLVVRVVEVDVVLGSYAEIGCRDESNRGLSHIAAVGIEPHGSCHRDRRRQRDVTRHGTQLQVAAGRQPGDSRSEAAARRNRSQREPVRINERERTRRRRGQRVDVIRRCVQRDAARSGSHSQC